MEFKNIWRLELVAEWVVKSQPCFSQILHISPRRLIGQKLGIWVWILFPKHPSFQLFTIAFMGQVKNVGIKYLWDICKSVNNLLDFSKLILSLSVEFELWIDRDIPKNVEIYFQKRLNYVGWLLSTNIYHVVSQTLW